MLRNLLLRKMLKAQLKGVPEDQKEKILANSRYGGEESGIISKR